MLIFGQDLAENYAPIGKWELSDLLTLMNEDIERIKVNMRFGGSKFWRRLKSERPSSSRATSSPSTTVLSGSLQSDCDVRELSIQSVAATGIECDLSGRL